MSQLEIIIGSQMGGTEYVAEQLSDLMEDQGISCTLHEQPDLKDMKMEAAWLICTSTHGAGDYPDNLQPFVEDLNALTNLDNIRFAIIGIGDSSYDTYNYAAKNIEQLLLSKQAQPLLPRLEIDVLSEDLPEDTAERWLPELLKHL